MRIVGGKWRGRQIEAPDGRDVTRPTTDRTREQIASMILSAAGLDLSGTSVLDAFAGSGAIQREDGFYSARTCLTLDMAYNNARLICRPESSWIKRG